MEKRIELSEGDGHLKVWWDDEAQGHILTVEEGQGHDPANAIGYFEVEPDDARFVIDSLERIHLLDTDEEMVHFVRLLQEAQRLLSAS